MSVLRFAAPTHDKIRPPADDMKLIVSELANDLQILAVCSPHLLARLARAVHQIVGKDRACLRVHLDHHLDQVNQS